MKGFLPMDEVYNYIEDQEAFSRMLLVELGRYFIMGVLLKPALRMVSKHHGVSVEEVKELLGME
ncbi:MAG: hypothetical protein M0R51_16445 [Clostridia bacterium]|jgi:hypothetical protein|nr:hypothetical protein [Clostridia bacterium]